MRAVTYKVIPITNSTGIIECVKHCMPLKDIKKCAQTNKWGETHRNNLVASAAASYIASYIIGIRDRHDDNVILFFRERGKMSTLPGKQISVMVSFSFVNETETSREREHYIEHLFWSLKHLLSFFFFKILVKNDGTLFHIDFGFFLGQETSVDACAFAVTPELLEILGDKKWSEFVQVTILKNYPSQL